MHVTEYNSLPSFVIPNDDMTLFCVASIDFCVERGSKLLTAACHVGTGYSGLNTWTGLPHCFILG